MTSKTFDAQVRKTFAPRLAALGFERHGVRYFRPCPPWGVQGLLLQQDKWNGTGFCRFSVLLTRALKPGLDAGKLVARAKVDQHLFDTVAGGRIGNATWLGLLTEARRDFQYDYSPDDAASVEAALREALADIERYGLFWLRWGFRRPGVRHDPARFDAAKKRFDAHLAGIPTHNPGAD